MVQLLATRRELQYIMGQTSSDGGHDALRPEPGTPKLQACKPKIIMIKMHNSKLITAVVGAASVARAAAIPGLESDGFNSTLTARAGPVYKVRDLTGPALTAQFESGFTDLGIPALTPDGRLIFVCGDTFADRVGGANWRSPIALFSSNTDLDSVLIDGSVGGPSAVGLVPEGHVGGTTAIPSDVFVIGDKMYMNLMRGVIYQTVRTFTRLVTHRRLSSH